MEGSLGSCNDCGDIGLEGLGGGIPTIDGSFGSCASGMSVAFAEGNALIVAGAVIIDGSWRTADCPEE